MNAVTTAMSKVVTQAKQRFLLSNQKKKNEMQPLEDRERETGDRWKVKVRAGGGGGVLSLQVGADGVQIWILESKNGWA